MILEEKREIELINLNPLMNYMKLTNYKLHLLLLVVKKRKHVSVKKEKSVKLKEEEGKPKEKEKNAKLQEEKGDINLL